MSSTDTSQRVSQGDVEEASVQTTYTSVPWADDPSTTVMVTLRARLQRIGMSWEVSEYDCARTTALFLLDLLPVDARVLLAVVRRADLQTGGDVFYGYMDEGMTCGGMSVAVQGLCAGVVNGGIILGGAGCLAVYLGRASAETVLAWVTCCVLWIAFTILIMEPLHVIAVHYCLPLLVRHDVDEARDVVLRTLRRHELHERMASQPTGLASRLRTAKYMLTSCRLADERQVVDRLSRLLSMYEPLSPLMYPSNSPLTLRPFSTPTIHKLLTITRLCINESYCGGDEAGTTPISNVDSTGDVAVGRKRNRSLSGHPAGSAAVVAPLPGESCESPVGLSHVPLIDKHMEKWGYVQWMTLRFLLSLLIRVVSDADKSRTAPSSALYSAQSEARVCVRVGCVLHLLLQLIIFALLLAVVWVHLLLFRVLPILVVVPGAVLVVFLACAYSLHGKTARANGDGVDSRHVCTCSQLPRSLYDDSATGLRLVTQCGCVVCLALEKYSCDRGQQVCALCEERHMEGLGSPSRNLSQKLSTLSSFLSAVRSNDESCAESVLVADGSEPDGGESSGVDPSPPEDAVDNVEVMLSADKLDDGGLKSWVTLPSLEVAASPSHQLMIRPFTSPSESGSDDSWSMSPTKLAATLGIQIREKSDSLSEQAIYPISIDENAVLEVQPPQYKSYLKLEQGTVTHTRLGIADVRPAESTSNHVSLHVDSKQGYHKAVTVRENYQSDSLARYQDMLLQRSVAKLQLKQRRSAGKSRALHLEDMSDTDSIPSSIQSPRSAGKSSRKSEEALAAVKNRLVKGSSPMALGARQRTHSANSEMDEDEVRVRSREVHNEHKCSVAGLEENMSKDKKRSQDLLAKRLSERRKPANSSDIYSDDV